MPKKVYLCGKCVAMLAGDFKLETISSTSKKDTCGQCGKRRFCYQYDIRKPDKA